jgi:hypothetical protein
MYGDDVCVSYYLSFCQPAAEQQQQQQHLFVFVFVLFFAS